jgi:asparagine synthase (glutamine-hydrolysing)
MCGIGGVVGLDGTPPPREVLAAMGAALCHRGPDAEGIHVDGDGRPAVGLLHRRLSIIDLSRVADQPIGNEDGSVLAMLNGEVYNFRELRSGLEGRHRFRSHGDTEVIVHGYEDRGDSIVAALDGMFAIALWDAGRRRLLLARDALGKKPLYHWSDGRRFVFASEVKGLLAAGVPAEMNREVLGEYLTLGYVPTPHTFFRGIHRLPPSCTLVVDRDGVHEPRPYWDLDVPDAADVRDVPLDEAAERVRDLLRDAVRKRLIADVPLGILLSGGVDSSAVAALAAGLVSSPVKTFTVGFDDSAFHDEREAAARTAAALGTVHHADVVRPEAAELLPVLLHHHDEPFGDSSALPTYVVAQAARRHVTVVLNGDGGDETFAGYDRFHAALLAESIPSPVRGLARRVLETVPAGADAHTTGGRIQRFVREAPRPLVERMAAWSAFFDAPALEAVLPGFDQARAFAAHRAAYDRHPRATPLSRLLYASLRTYLLDDLLPKMDRMSMAHGLEARSPLLDRPLMEYVARLPDGLKRRGRRGKVVLKAAIRGLVPDEVLSRPKHGFGLPLAAWLRGSLRGLVEDTLLQRPLVGRHLREDGVRSLVAEHLEGRRDRAHALWTLLTLELWLRRHRFE